MKKFNNYLEEIRALKPGEKLPKGVRKIDIDSTEVKSAFSKANAEDTLKKLLESKKQIKSSIEIKIKELITPYKYLDIKDRHKLFEILKTGFDETLKELKK